MGGHIIYIETEDEGASTFSSIAQMDRTQYRSLTMHAYRAVGGISHQGGNNFH